MAHLVRFTLSGGAGKTGPIMTNTGKPLKQFEKQHASFERPVEEGALENEARKEIFRSGQAPHQG